MEMPSIWSKTGMLSISSPSSGCPAGGRARISWSADEKLPLDELRARRVEVGRRPVFAARLQPQRRLLRRRLHHGPEAVVVDQLDRLDRVLDREVPVVDREQVVSVRLLAARGEVRRAREDGRVLVVEVDDDELVVDHLAGAAVPLL